MPGPEPEPVIFDADSAVFNDVRAAASHVAMQGETDAQF